jgi:hypothetical protein
MKQNNPDLLRALDEAWDDEAGFLGRLRYRNFDAASGQKYVELLESIDVEEGAFSAEFVRLLWFVPLFLEWRVADMRGDSAEQALAAITDKVRTRVMELLGTP